MDCHYLQSEQFLLFVSFSIRNTTVELERVFTVRELSLIMTGRGQKLNCRGLKFFPANLLGSETIDKHLDGVSN